VPFFENQSPSKTASSPPKKSQKKLSLSKKENTHSSTPQTPRPRSGATRLPLPRHYCWTVLERHAAADVFGGEGELKSGLVFFRQYWNKREGGGTNGEIGRKGVGGKEKNK
jgi:hypothetical protein